MGGFPEHGETGLIGRAGLACEQPIRGVLVARLSGELDLDTVPALETALDDAVRRETPHRVVIDLSGVTLMSLKGVGLLMLMRRRARVTGAHLVLSGSSRRSVAQPLRLSGALPLFDTRVDIEHALGARGVGPVSIPGPRRRSEAWVR